MKVHFCKYVHIKWITLYIWFNNLKVLASVVLLCCSFVIRVELGRGLSWRGQGAGRLGQGAAGGGGGEVLPMSSGLHGQQGPGARWCPVGLVEASLEMGEEVLCICRLLKTAKTSFVSD